MRSIGILIIFSLFFLVPTHASDETKYQKRRARLVKEIQASVRDTESYIGKSSLNPLVMKVMGNLPRHDFVPASQKPFAYFNRPLPIGHGQTISQPYIVALMTDLLDVGPNDKVFELGTGSGYQAAMLSELVKEVYTVEIVPELGRSAKKRFQQLGYHNIKSKVGDGYYGWKENAPYDAIIVTAASNQIPPPLLEQLKPGGNMVIPVGAPFTIQQLVLVKKDKQGKIHTQQMLPVRFVPIRRNH